MYHRNSNDFFRALASFMTYAQCVVLPLLAALLALRAPATFAQTTQPFTAADYQTNHKKLQIYSRQLFRGVGFRDVLNKLSRASEVSIWLDRRVDPDQLIDLHSQEQSFAQTLLELNQRTATRSVWLGGLLYIAPAEKAAEIEYAYWVAATQSEQQLFRRTLQSRNWRAPIEPAELIAKVASEAGVKFDGLSGLEHDVWRAGQLPSSNAAAIMLALLAGFDRTFKNVEGRIVLVPITAPPDRLAWAYDPRWLSSLASPHKAAWQEKWQHASQWKQTGDQIWLNAPLQAHRELATQIANISDELKAGIETVKTSKKNRQRYTLRLRGRLVDVMPSLISNLKLESNVSALPLALQERTIDISVENVTLNELLAAIGESAGVQISLVEQRVQITQ